MQPLLRFVRRDGVGPRRARRVGVLAAVAVATTVPVAYASLADSVAISTTVATAQLAPPANLAVSQTCGPLPVTIVRRGATSAAGAGSLVLSTPSGTVAGDVLVAQVANRSGTIPLTAPDGWNLLGRDTSGTAVTSALFWRVAAAGEPASATFSLNGSSVQMGGGIAAYSGVRASDPIDVFGVAVGTGVMASTPSVTTTTSGAMLVHAVAKRQEDLAPPSGTGSLWRLVSGTGNTAEGVSAGDELAAGAGPTAVRTTSSGLDAEWVIDTVALRPRLTPSAAATWTATTSTWATGYRLERSVGTSVQATATVASRAATSTTNGPLVNDTTYTYRLWAYYRSWTSPAVSATFTPSC